MKKVYIVHGWDGSPEEPSNVWMKKQLEKEGFIVESLAMPHAEAPVIEEWVVTLRGSVENLDKNTFFIGHSIGVQAIMRYLAESPEHTKIGGAIFLAGWFTLTNLEDEKAEEIARPWIETPIDFESLREKTNNYVVILSDNDAWVPADATKSAFEKNLGAKVIIEHKKGHFTEDEGVTEVPSVITELKRIAVV